MSNQNGSQLERPLVYFVDDETDILDVFEGYFGPRFDVALFNKPEEAISAAKLARQMGRSPNAIVTDFRMPKVTGLELISRIREDGTDAKAILLSGNLDKEIVIKAANRGVYRILEKPFDGVEIERAIDSLLTEQRAETIRNEIQNKVIRLKEMYSALRMLMKARIPEFDEILEEQLFDPTQPKVDIRFEDVLEELELSVDQLLNDEGFVELTKRKAS